MNKLVNLVFDSIDKTVEWSDWFNPVVWQAIWMEWWNDV